MLFYAFGQNNPMILCLPSPSFTWWSRCSLSWPTLNESRVTPVFFVSLNMESGSIKLSCISRFDCGSKYMIRSIPDPVPPNILDTQKTMINDIYSRRTKPNLSPQKRVQLSVKEMNSRNWEFSLFNKYKLNSQFRELGFGNITVPTHGYL